MNIDNENENMQNINAASEENKEVIVENTQIKEEPNNTATEEKTVETAETAQTTQPEEPTNNKKIKTKKSNPLLKAISITIKTILWALIFITLSLLLITVASQKTDVLGYRLYIIMSGSMEPVIHVKDAIITKQIDEPQNGDIIAFQNGNMITVHRIIKVYTEGDNRLYQTKGDNNNADDPGLVQKSQIKGKVQFILPFVGDAILFLQSHFIIMILAIGIIVIIIIARRLI